MTAEQRLYYLAGFFDGEGCISIVKYMNRGYRVAIICGQHDRPILELFKAEFGGTIYLAKVRSIPWTYQWQLIRRTEQEVFLAKITPLLILKRAEAEVALQFFETLPTKDQCGGYWKNKLTEDRKIQRDALFIKAKFLKKQRNLICDVNGQYVFRGRPKPIQTLFRG